MKIFKKLFFMFILIVAATPSNFLYADELSSDFVLGGRIVWSHNGDLLWANPDGNDNNIYRITDTPWVEKNPTISPDGRFVAYASNRNSDNWSLETGFSIEILELGANDVTQSIKMLTTPEDGNCMNPTWIWNDKFFTEETLDPNGIIAFDCTLYGDSGIFAKYPQKISGPKIAIRDELGRSETNPTFYEKGTADIGRFKDNYMFLWEEFKNAEGQIGINLGILSIGDFYPQEDDPCNINTYSMYSKCLNLRGSSWTFGIEGHSPSWFTGIPDSYNFPGSKGQHLFAFVREGNTPGTTKFMWATIPDENIFGRDDRREGELTSGIYGGFGINFTEVLEPKFSPFDQPVVAHYMRDTNPLKNDNGSLKILNSGDQITERIDISKFRPDFDWGEFDLIETVSQSGISMEQFRGRIAGRLDSDYEEKYTNEQERIELELKELQDLENLRIDQQAELIRKQQELDQIEFDNLSRERQDEIENQMDRRGQRKAYNFITEGEFRPLTISRGVQELFEINAERLGLRNPFEQAEDVIDNIRGYGMMGGIDMKLNTKPGKAGYETFKYCYEAGVNFKATGDCLIIAPQFICEEKHIDEIIDKLRIGITNYQKNQKN